MLYLFLKDGWPKEKESSEQITITSTNKKKKNVGVGFVNEIKIKYTTDK